MQKAPLSDMQSRILRFIEREISRLGRPPTYRDIAQHFGFKAVGSAQDHIRALIRKGFLEPLTGQARGFRLTHFIETSPIPILGAVPAGRPIEAIEDRQGALPVPTGLRGELFALRVTGESMIEAGILDGDYVVVRKQKTAENGEIVVAIIDGEATVKTLEKKGSRLRLLPANPKFNPIEVPEHSAGSGELIQGKVVSVQRYYDSDLALQ